VNPNHKSIFNSKFRISQTGGTHQAKTADMREYESPRPVNAKLDAGCVYAMTDASKAGYGVVLLNGRKSATTVEIRRSVHKDGIHWTNNRELNGLMLWLEWFGAKFGTKSLRNRRVVWFCDNKTAVDDVNNRRNVLTKSTAMSAESYPQWHHRKDMILRLTTLESFNHFHVQAVWIPGATAVLADEGSRVDDIKCVTYDLPGKAPLFVGEVRRDTDKYFVLEDWLEYFEVFWPEFNLTYVQHGLSYQKEGVGSYQKEGFLNGKLYLATRKSSEKINSPTSDRINSERRTKDCFRINRGCFRITIPRCSGWLQPGLLRAY